MRKWFKRTAKRIVVILVGLGLCAGLWLGLAWLRHENYLFWATGTRDKAFLHTTWQMSPKEVARATGYPLEKGSALSLLLLLDSTDQLDPVDKGRLQVLCQEKHYTLWGNQADVTYLFFDHQLYAYGVVLTTYDVHDISLIRTALARRFGREHAVGQNTPGCTRLEWATPKQRVKFSVIRAGDKSSGYEYNIFVDAFYLPLESRLRQIVTEEKNRYF